VLEPAACALPGRRSAGQRGGIPDRRRGGGDHRRRTALRIRAGAAGGARQPHGRVAPLVAARKCARLLSGVEGPSGVYSRRVSHLMAEALLKVAERVARLSAWRVELPDFTSTWSDGVRAIRELPLGFVPILESSIASCGSVSSARRSATTPVRSGGSRA